MRDENLKSSSTSCSTYIFGQQNTRSAKEHNKAIDKNRKQQQTLHLNTHYFNF